MAAACFPLVLCSAPREGHHSEMDGCTSMTATAEPAEQHKAVSSPGSLKQRQDLSTTQMRAQEHSLAVGLLETLPNPCPEQRDAGSSYCGTLELHRRVLFELGRAGRGLLYHICHLLVCFAILCSSWLRSKTPTCSPKDLLGLGKQTTGRDGSGEGEGKGAERRRENQNLIKDTFASGPLKITNS